MPNNADSTSLFLNQVGEHTQVLSGLLSLPADKHIDEKMMERSVLSTTMLANSASLMDLGEWQEFLQGYTALLRTYRELDLLWDERIAQLTSELIEREDRLTEVRDEGPSLILKEVVSPIELEALSQELKEVLDAIGESVRIENETPAQTKHPADSALEMSAEMSADVATDVAVASQPLEKSVAAMQRYCSEFVEGWQSASWDGTNGAAADELRKKLLLIDFFAQSIERGLNTKTDSYNGLDIDPLNPLRCALEDFAGILCQQDDRTLTVNVHGAVGVVEAKLLLPVQRVFQHMIEDIFARCTESELNIDISMEERIGCLFCTVRDNGSNFIKDSHLDPDEHLAFYPGLKETSRILSELNSLLWVEPDDDKQSRFAFTLPLTTSCGSFVVWGEGTEQFSVLSNQVSDVIPMEEAEIQSDARGDFFITQGRRVPVLKLEQLFEGAPGEGDSIALIGRLEKRIAFHVNGDGRMMQGEWLRDSLPAWKGMRQGVVQFEDEKTPLVEADELIRRYVSMMTDDTGERISGGASEEFDLSQTQASAVKEPPPEMHSSEYKTDVLVMERSEVLRDSFIDILAAHELRAKVVQRLEDAIECITGDKPSLIIAEFRLPSMAAKILVEKVREAGEDIPVLVTTSHKGENAELLVTKLGATGYISKPLNPDEVMERLSGFFPKRVPRT